MAKWPGFDKKNRNWENYTKQAACFVQFTLFRLKNRNWVSWPCFGTANLQNRPIPLDSSRKLANSSLRQQGAFFNVPGRKSLASVEISRFVFWNDNGWPQHDPKYDSVTFESLLHAAFLFDEIWGDMLEPACIALQL